MLIRLVIGSFLSSVVLMVWGMVFWMFTPFPDEMMDKLPDEAATAKALVDKVPQTGTYFYPRPDKDTMRQPESEASKEFMAKHKAGPLFQLIYIKEGVEVMEPKVFVFGFAHFLIASLLVGLVLVVASRGVSGYPARWLLATLVVLFGPVAITLSSPIWFYHPWKFALYMAGFQAVGWLLAAMVLALIIRPSRA